MSTQDNGGPAFPRPAGDFNGTKHGNGAQQGMTLRDYFAAKAMQSILSALVQGIRPQDCIKAAEDAYFLADAMLKARQQ